MSPSPPPHSGSRQCDPRSIANLLVQPKNAEARATRAALYPPNITDLSGYGSPARVKWIANLHSHMAGGPALDTSRYDEPPELARDGNDSVMIVSYQPTPLGVFWRTGRRDPVPPNNPGTPPFSVPSSFDVPPPLNRTTWAECAGPGHYPGPLFYRHEDPAIAGRYEHRHQPGTIIWGWSRDGAVFARRGRQVSLAPHAYDAVMLLIADCEAISQAAILCHESVSADLCPNGILRPGNIRWPLLSTIQEQRRGLDDFREGCLMHLATAAILLRGIPINVLQRALLPNWTYPSFPGGTFFDAIEAYGVLDASFAGIIFDMGMPTLDHMPPLSLFAEWNIPYGWLVPRGTGEGTAWLRDSFAWMDMVFWDVSLLHDRVRDAERRSLEAEEQRLNRFSKFALIHEDSRQEFESRVGTQIAAAARRIDGLNLEWVSRSRVRDELLFKRMKYEEHFPNGTVIFRSWTDLKPEQDRAAYRQGRLPRSIPGTISARLYDRMHPPEDDEDEDDIEDDPQIVLRKASEFGVRLPVPVALPVDGEWRVARPPPRPIAVRENTANDWLSSLENGAPTVVSSYLSITPTISSPKARSPKAYEDRLPSAGLEAPPPSTSRTTWAEVARRARLSPPSPRPTKQNSPTRQPWHERFRTRSPYRHRSPPRPDLRRDPPPHRGRSPTRYRYEHPPENRYRPNRSRDRADRTRTRHRSRSPRRSAPRDTTQRRSRSPPPVASRQRQPSEGSSRPAAPTPPYPVGDKGKGRMPGERPHEASSLLETLHKAQSLGGVDPGQLREAAATLLSIAEQLLSQGQETNAEASPPTAPALPAPQAPAADAAGIAIRGAAQRAEQPGSRSHVGGKRYDSTHDQPSVELNERISSGLPLAARISSGTSLQERISPSTPAADAPASSTAKITVTRDLLEKAEDASDPADPWGLEPRRPIPPSAGYDSPRAGWPKSAQLLPLGLDFPSCMRLFNPKSPVIDDYWPERVNRTMPPVLTRGIFRLRLGSWLCFMHFRHQHPDCPPEDFLRYATSRGIAYDLGERGIVMEVVDEEMPSELPSSLSLDEWRDRARALLQEPRALQFVRDGGIAWRIALDLGREGLIADALESVSVQRRAPLASEPAWPESILVDRPSARDYAVLTGAIRAPNERGVIEDRSWMPHPDLWDTLFPGEWSSAAEFWYLRRITPGAKDRGKPFQPRMAHEWRKEVRSVAPVAMRPFLSEADPRRAAILARLGNIAVQPYWDVDIEGEELANMDTD